MYAAFVLPLVRYVELQNMTDIASVRNNSVFMRKLPWERLRLLLIPALYFYNRTINMKYSHGNIMSGVYFSFLFQIQVAWKCCLNRLRCLLWSTQFYNILQNVDAQNGRELSQNRQNAYKQKKCLWLVLIGFSWNRFQIVIKYLKSTFQRFGFLLAFVSIFFSGNKSALSLS